MILQWIIFYWSLSQTLSCTIPSESTVCLVACELDRQRRQTDSATLFLTPTLLAHSLSILYSTNEHDNNCTVFSDTRRELITYWAVEITQNKGLLDIDPELIRGPLGQQIPLVLVYPPSSLALLADKNHLSSGRKPHLSEDDGNMGLQFCSVAVRIAENMCSRSNTLPC